MLTEFTFKPNSTLCHTGCCSNGDIAEGLWLNDKLNGRASYTWKNGDWLSNNYNGEGILIWPNKNRYEGKMYGGYASGKGKFYRNDVLLYEGNFDGTSTASYTRAWLLKDGIFTKRTVYNDGSLFEIYYPDGRSFFGSIKEIGIYGNMNEIQPLEGFMLYPDGKVVVGTWENNAIKTQSSSVKWKVNGGIVDYTRARTQHAYKKYSDALKSFNAAVAKGTKEDSLALFRGLCYYSVGNADSAIADFNSFLKKSPKSKDALTYRAKTYFIKKDTATGLVDYNNYVKNYPKDSIGYWQRGFIYYSQKNYDKAIADYNKTLECSKGGVENVYYYRGMSYEALGRKEEACADYKKATGVKNAEVRLKSLCGPPPGGS